MSTKQDKLEQQQKQAGKSEKIENMMSFFKTNCILRPVNIRWNECGDGDTKQSRYCQQKFFLKENLQLLSHNAVASVITISKIQLPPLLLFIFLSFLFMATVKT